MSEAIVNMVMHVMSFEDTTPVSNNFGLPIILEENDRPIVKAQVEEWENDGGSMGDMQSIKELFQRIGNAILSYDLWKLTQEGLVQPMIDENGDWIFDLTPEGKQLAELFGDLNENI